MEDITQQAVMMLSKSVLSAAANAVNSATFARFYSGKVLRMVEEGVYQIAMGDQVVTLPVYGNNVFKYGQSVYVISPHNSKEFSKMFILGMGGKGAEEDSEDHQLLMQLLQDVNNKLDEGVVVQEPGQSSTNIMSQKAVTDLINELNFDGIQGVILGTTPLEPNPANNHVTIPVARTNMLGVVLSKEQVNGVTVDQSGSMSVHSVDVMKLHQDSDNVVILDGGNASTWSE